MGEAIKSFESKFLWFIFVCGIFLFLLLFAQICFQGSCNCHFGVAISYICVWKYGGRFLFGYKIWDS